MTALEWIAVVMVLLLCIAIPVLWSYEGEIRGFTGDDDEGDPS